ncbi:hypothetical protein ECDEC10F_1601 [Escherichia coli DEC10F]|nr:hypothetical protein ECDEC10F_1601 [Escherichia coli DEC10F]
MVTFLFIQKLVEDFRRRSTCTNQRQNGSRQAVFYFFRSWGFIDF